MMRAGRINLFPKAVNYYNFLSTEYQSHKYAIIFEERARLSFYLYAKTALALTYLVRQKLK